MKKEEPTVLAGAPEQNTEPAAAEALPAEAEPVWDPADAAETDGPADAEQTDVPADAAEDVAEADAAENDACLGDAGQPDAPGFGQTGDAAEAEEAALERALDAAMMEAGTDPEDDGNLDLSGDFSNRERSGFDIKKLLIPLFALVAVGLIVWAVLRSGGTEGHLVISEVVTSNQSILTDEALGTPDFVELYNSGTTDINVSGYGLSDSMKHCYRYRLPDVTIPAGGYLLIYFTGGTEEADSSPYCTGFGLSRDGETVVLVDAHYGLLSQLDVPALEPDAAYALRADGTYGITYTPTPGAANIVPDAE